MHQNVEFSFEIFSNLCELSIIDIYCTWRFLKVDVQLRQSLRCSCWFVEVLMKDGISHLRLSWSLGGTGTNGKRVVLGEGGGGGEADRTLNIVDWNMMISMMMILMMTMTMIMSMSLVDSEGIKGFVSLKTDTINTDFIVDFTLQLLFLDKMSLLNLLASVIDVRYWISELYSIKLFRFAPG